MLEARSEQNQVIVGDGAAPYLSDADTLTASDVISLPATLAILQGDHAWLRVVLVTLVGTYHPTALEMKQVNTEIMERDMDLKE